jgi:hypothetical protein
MDARSLIAGLVIGAVGSSLVHRAIDRERESAPETQQRIAGQVDAEARADAEVAARESRASMPDAGSAVAPTSDEETLGGKAEASVRARPPSTANSPPGTAPVTTTTSLSDTSVSARAVRMKEDKDVAWSPYMEQTLRQFLAGHRLIHQFDIRGIDCRTTFCNIVAVGFDDSTGPVWTQVVHDMQRQPWSEFGQVGSSTRDLEGRPLFETTLHRKER